MHTWSMLKYMYLLEYSLEYCNDQQVQVHAYVKEYILNNKC